MAYDEKLAARVRRLLSRKTGYSERKMFGGICFMLNGHMCSGVLNEDLIVRVGSEDYRHALQRPHTRRFDFTGKPMKGFVVVAPKGYRSDKSFKDWMVMGTQCARLLPAKSKNNKRKP